MKAAPAQFDLVAVVPVRAGSRGVAGKNIRLLAGQPLYLHAVHQGLRIVSRVLVSTDIPQIRQSDLPEGSILCPRPVELAADDTPMAAVIAHLIATQKLDAATLVLLQATSPLRSDDDVRRAVKLHGEGRHDMVMSVTPRDRGVLKYGTLDNGDFVALREPRFCFQNRQALPPVHGPNGAVFVFGAAAFVAADGFPSRRIGAVEMPSERSHDIDTEQDFNRVAELFAARHCKPMPRS